jgi:hypothetical protein
MLLSSFPDAAHQSVVDVDRGGIVAAGVQGMHRRQSVRFSGARVSSEVRAAPPIGRAALVSALRPISVIIRRALNLGTGEQVQAWAEESSALPLARRRESRGNHRPPSSMAGEDRRQGQRHHRHPSLVGTTSVSAVVPAPPAECIAATARLDRVSAGRERPDDPTPGRDGPGLGEPVPDMVLSQSPI